MARLTNAAFGFILPLMLAGAASAQAVPPSAALQNDAGDLRALENRIQRQQYQQQQQQQQQQFREQDRMAIPLNPQPPVVPVIRPGCQTQVYGNRVVGNCR